MWLGLLSLLLNACSSNDNGELIRSNSIEPQVQQLAHSEPHLIHVDMIERLATLRNGADLEGFLFTIDQEGEDSGTLKTLPLRNSASLRTADILEGRPAINDRIRPANDEESAALSKIYGDETTDTL